MYVHTNTHACVTCLHRYMPRKHAHLRLSFLAACQATLQVRRVWLGLRPGAQQSVWRCDPHGTTLLATVCECKCMEMTCTNERERRERERERETHTHTNTNTNTHTHTHARVYVCVNICMYVYVHSQMVGTQCNLLWCNVINITHLQQNTKYCTILKCTQYHGIQDKIKWRAGWNNVMYTSTPCTCVMYPYSFSADMYTRIRACVRACVRTYARTYIRTYIRVRIYVRIYVDNQI